ncbi:MAG: hypothetical protein AB2A00_14295 [Myxococcota bacterium]
MEEPNPDAVSARAATSTVSHRVGSHSHDATTSSREVTTTLGHALPCVTGDLTVDTVQPGKPQPPEREAGAA